MPSRKPIVAGQFYPNAKEAVMSEIKSCLGEYALPDDLPAPIVSGIVPHAGWAFSGGPAGMVFNAIKQQNEAVDTFILFGAAHGYYDKTPAVYGEGSWLSPLGEVQIDGDLAAEIVQSEIAINDPAAHRGEHSIEVQIPFVQYLFENAKIVPIVVPASDISVRLGDIVGRIISDSEKRIVCIGSTDLTHYGPHYGYTPMGFGDEGFQWSKNVNDRQFIDLALELDAENVVTNALDNSSACGPGAAAATLAAAKKLGSTQARLLVHTNSAEVMTAKMGIESQDAVGYAAIVM